MKKSTFIANIVVWCVVLAGMGAFQLWYRSVDSQTGFEAVTGSMALSLLLVLSGPFLLYSLGALAGLVLVWLKKICLHRGARLACRVVSALVAAVVVLAVVPLLLPGAGDAVGLALALVVLLSMAAPVFYVGFGLLYALAFAPLDPNQKKPLVTGPFTPDEDE